jgi:hypothetical protein
LVGHLGLAVEVSAVHHPRDVSLDVIELGLWCVPRVSPCPRIPMAGVGGGGGEW